MTKAARFLVGAITILLLTKVCFTCGALQQHDGGEQSQKVRMPVRAGRIVRLDSGHHLLVLRTRGRTWRVTVTDHPLLIKNGVAVNLGAFHSGETVVVQDYDAGFTTSISDPHSFAAFVRDTHILGTIVNFDPATAKITVRGSFTRLEQWSSPEAFVTTVKFSLQGTTQFWLNGKRMTMTQARAKLQPGTPIHITQRFDAYKRGKPWNNPAYALFDSSSWKQFAESELRNPEQVYQPAKTVMPDGKDTTL
jgi:hypothetical protein